MKKKNCSAIQYQRRLGTKKGIQINKKNNCHVMRVKLVCKNSSWSGVKGVDFFTKQRCFCYCVLVWIISVVLG